MVFRPHYGRLAAQHAPAHIRYSGDPIRVSAHAAVQEAFGLFAWRPLPGLLLCLILVAALALSILPYPLLDHLSFGVEVGPSATTLPAEGPHWRDVVSVAGIHVALLPLQLITSTAFIVVVAAPLLIGVMGCSVPAARRGAPRIGCLLVGFRQYRSACWLGAIWSGVTVTLVFHRTLGAALAIAACAALWLPVCALADRRSGPWDALRHGTRLLRRLGWPLLAVCAVSAALAGIGWGAGATTVSCGVRAVEAADRVTSWSSSWPGPWLNTVGGMLNAVGCLAGFICFVASVTVSLYTLGVAYRDANHTAHWAARSYRLPGAPRRDRRLSDG